MNSQPRSRRIKSRVVALHSVEISGAPILTSTGAVEALESEVIALVAWLSVRRLPEGNTTTVAVSESDPSTLLATTLYTPVAPAVYIPELVIVPPVAFQVTAIATESPFDILP
jgi:hypothetical protein